MGGDQGCSRMEADVEDQLAGREGMALGSRFVNVSEL